MQNNGSETKEKKLTVKLIEAAKAREKDYFLSDTLVCSGLMVRVRTSGKKTFSFRYSLGKRTRVLKIGDAEFVTLQEARRLANIAKSLIAQGICPVEQAEREAEEKALKEKAEREVALSLVTFSQAIERWGVLDLSKRKDKGAEPLRAIRRDFYPSLGDRDLKDIKKADLLKVLDAVVERGSRVMANKLLTDIKQFYRWAYDRDLVESEPLIRINKKSVGGNETERDRYLSESEVIELHNKLKTLNLVPQIKIAIWVMISTLCRVGEFSRAEWAHIDLEGGTWIIPSDNSKNGFSHLIYLSDFAKGQFKLLREITGWSDFVYPSRLILSDGIEKPVGDKHISKQIGDRQTDKPQKNRTKDYNALILSSGKWTSHDLRRTGATMMAGLQNPPHVVELCLNHTENNRMKRIYQLYEYEPQMKSAWNGLGKWLEELLGRTP